MVEPNKKTTYNLKDFQDACVLVVGDVMLDTWIYGTSRRISPEAPVPIINYKSQTHMLGGAANVARNIAHLEGKSILAGVVGTDREADTYHKLLDKEKRIINAGISIPQRQTTTKTRIVTNNHQMARIDMEQTDPLKDLVAQQLLSKIFDIIVEHPIKAVVISDYGKGTVTDQVCHGLLTWARDWIPVLVDPKGTDWKKYAGASVITPNLQELCAMVKQPDLDDLEIIHHSNNLIQIYDFWSMLVTRAEQGMTMCLNTGEQYNIPAQVREVADASGAGDTVIATLAMAMCAGYELTDAMHMANVAAGISVSKKGTATVDIQELQKALDTLA